MPCLTSTSEFTVARIFTTDVSAARVLAIVHDHVSWIEMHPLVIKAEKESRRHHLPTAAREGGNFNNSTSSWVRYRITDKVPVLGLVTYDAWFQDTELGINTYVKLPMGLKVWTEWTAKDRTVGLKLSEDIRVMGNLFLMPFAKHHFAKAHVRMMCNLVDEASRDHIGKV